MVDFEVPKRFGLRQTIADTLGIGGIMRGLRTISSRGIEPQRVGALPRHVAALVQTNVNVQGLTVQAAVTGRREPVCDAAMLDPHTGAELTLDEIAALVDACSRPLGTGCRRSRWAHVTGPRHARG